MLVLKQDVRLANLSSQIVLAADIVNACYQNVGVKVCTITSGSDGKHMAGSKHYGGFPSEAAMVAAGGTCRAFDFRSKDVPRDRLPQLDTSVRLALGPDFDVVLEDQDGPNEHLHVEYDPKGA